MTCLIVLPYSAARVSARDLAEIRARIEAADGALDFRPFDVARPPGWLSEPPGGPTLCLTLNVAPVGRMLDRLPGRKLVARPVHKLEQLRRLRAAGAPLPATAVLGPETPVTEARFGPHVVVKTTAPGTSRGGGITFLRTADFERHRARLLDLHEAEIAAGSPPVVQAFVPTGPRPTHVRVLTAFGRPILAYRTTARHRFDPDAAAAAGAEATSNARADRERRLEDDPAIAAAGAAAAAAFPDTPVVGVDVVRSTADGRLLVLEANTGNIAPLSSPICSGLRADLGAEAALAQFGAYGVIADGILAQARALAAKA